MNKKIIAALFLFIASVCFGQAKFLRRSIYFPTDKYDVGKAAEKTLDSLTDFIHTKYVTAVIVRGNTDSDADSMYNITLSKNRVGAITNYFTGKAVPARLFLTKYYGKNNPLASNGTDEGKQINRRADITICYKEKQEEKPEPEAAVKETHTDECDRDTFVTLPEGISFSMNRCEYLLHKDCMVIKEYIKPTSLLGSGVTTQTTTGEQLESGGMFNFKYCDGETLAHPIKFYVPVPNNGMIYRTCAGTVDPKDMSLWRGKADGTWYQDNAQKLKTVTINDKLYYEVIANGPGGYNCDKLKGYEGSAFSQNIKFKAKCGLTMKKVSVLYRTPLTKYVKRAGWRKNIVKFNSQVCNTCNSEILISAEAINAQGQNVVIKARPLSEFKIHRRLSKCNKRIGYLYGIFPIRERKLFRKYILYPSDFEIDTNNTTQPAAVTIK